MEEKKIRNFYKNKNILITGGTGFIGQLLVDKLLRSCDGINQIYLLVRDKKGKTAAERVDEYFDKEIFKTLKAKHPNCRSKLTGLTGELSKPFLGLSEEDQECLKKNINIVFHVAATTSFVDPLRVAISINLIASKEVLSFCKTFNNVDAFIYVSTAYSNCPSDLIEEKIYENSNIISWKSVIKLLDILNDQQLAAVTPALLKEWPNTYCFSKAMTEKMLQDTQEHVPVGIIRPGIVISTAYEPIRGWAANFQSPTAGLAAIYAGFLKVIQARHKSNSNLVPADMCVNAIIPSAWDVNQRLIKEKIPLTVYNFALSDNLSTWGDLATSTLYFTRIYPVSTAVWHPILYIIESKRLSDFLKVFLHTIPAYLLHGLFKISGSRIGVLNKYRKLKKLMSVIEYFSMRTWSFETNNLYRMWDQLSLDEKQIFRFNLKELDWHTYMDGYISGMRTMLFKEDKSTIPYAQKRAKILYTIHQIFIFFVLIIFAYFLYAVFNILY